MIKDIVNKKKSKKYYDKIKYNSLIKNTKIFLLIIILSFIFIVSGCTEKEITCNKPYILSPAHCCLDQNNDGNCDEQIIYKESNKSCEKEVVVETKKIPVYKYVCPDNSIVDNVTLCNKEEEINFEPSLLNEKIPNNPIELFEVRPACRDGINSIELHYKIKRAYNKLFVQIKEKPNSPWINIYNDTNNLIEDYLYGAFCDNKCSNNVDFFIKPGKKYLLRIKLDYKNTDLNKIFYSNEHIIDDSEKGEYFLKTC